MYLFLLTLLASYLIGAIPFGYLTAKLVKGIDIRRHGSGNIGATNVGRVLGWGWFFPVFLLDVLKGVVPVLLALWLCRSGHLDETTAVFWRDALPPLAGLAAIVGHMWPIYLGFRGGKGVATSAGVIAVLTPIPALCAFAGWIITILLTRYVSLSSIAASVVLCVTRLIETWPEPFSAENAIVTALCLVGAVLIIVRHRSNIVRLWQGTEPTIGRKHAPTPLADGDTSPENKP